METNQLYEFGAFRLDVANARLLRDGEPVALPPKTFEVLRLLVGRAGRLVEKDALMREVWPDTFGIGDRARAIRWMQQAVADRSSFVPYLALDPVYAELRGERAFIELVDQVGLTKALTTIDRTFRPMAAPHGRAVR